MKFRVMSCQNMRSMPVNTLRGMDRPMTTVGRMVLNMPRMKVGRMVSMKAKTTDTANRKPKVPSCTSVSICRSISGPWSATTMRLTSSGMPSMFSSRSLTAVVTSRVLASAPFRTETARPGWPLVREMLDGRPCPRLTVATSERRTRPDGPFPTTRLLSSSTESREWVVLAMTACLPSNSSPAGRVRLFSWSTEET